MFKQLIILLLLLLGLSLQGNGQVVDNKKNKLGFKLGYDHSYFKDLNFSPLNYTTNGLLVDLSYQRITKNNNLVFSKLNFTYSNLKTDASEVFNTDRYLANLELGYLKSIPLGNQNGQLYIGGQYHTYVDMAFWNGTEGFTFFAVHSMDLSAGLTYPISKKQELESFISLPIFGKLVRPPYIGYDAWIADQRYTPVRVFFRGKWTSLNDFFGINWNTSYTYNLSSKWDFVTQYRFRYYRTKELYETEEERLAQIATNQLILGLYFKF